MPTNHQIHLDNRPTGEAVASNFKLVTAETPALQDGQVLDAALTERIKKQFATIS